MSADAKEKLTMKFRSLAPIAAVAMLVGAPVFAANAAKPTKPAVTKPAKHDKHEKKTKTEAPKAN
jgi:hypothetical protein